MQVHWLQESRAKRAARETPQSCEGKGRLFIAVTPPRKRFDADERVSLQEIWLPQELLRVLPGRSTLHRCVPLHGLQERPPSVHHWAQAEPRRQSRSVERERVELGPAVTRQATSGLEYSRQGRSNVQLK